MEGFPETRDPNIDPNMSYDLNSFRGVIWGIRKGSIRRVSKGDTRSLDNDMYAADAAAAMFMSIIVASCLFVSLFACLFVTPEHASAAKMMILA